MTIRNSLLTFLGALLPLVSAVAADKPRLTLDELFNARYFTALQLSPDGHSVVMGVQRADWDQNIFREDLWLSRDGQLSQLTQSGHDSAPKWSPDGRWIAFLSDRKLARDSSDDDSKDDGTSQLYLISPAGGEPSPITQGDEDVHAFAWSADSHTLYFATRQPWTKQQQDEYKKDWKDVMQYRVAERGDNLFQIDVTEAASRNFAMVSRVTDPNADPPAGTVGAHAIARTPWRVDEITVSPDGKKLAFATTSVSQRQEKVEEFEIYSVDLAQASPDHAPHQVTHNKATEVGIHWASDNRHILFSVGVGDVTNTYRDLQPHLYWTDAETGAVEQWGQDFIGATDHFEIAGDRILISGRLGTEVPVFSTGKPADSWTRLGVWAGTYENISAAANSPRVAFIYSALEKPTEIYLAESIDKLQDAKPITSFNKLFTERDLPKGKPYRWTADDGTAVEGMLMYPPGKFAAKNLPMFVLIHGGPADADGNHFAADWYQWDRFAATNGWLVFEPNYRGSTGYGDKFLAGIVPQLVSRPGKDIMAGVDALVKDGIANPDRLTIGGYSYGGYMTNWLITQTTRFKAAVTGAGAVEHIGNWGNDDTTFDDAYFLGGLPWEVADRYHDEAAIFQMNKVKTPTHLVAGADDIRVAVAEDYLLDHALHILGVPSTLLVFPGEGHSLDKNPWHGKIKVREEMKWLEKYAGKN